MDRLLRLRIWPSFLASSDVGFCDVPSRYENQHPAVARWHAHLRSLATAIHEISGLDLKSLGLPPPPSVLLGEKRKESLDIMQLGRSNTTLHNYSYSKGQLSTAV